MTHININRRPFLEDRHAVTFNKREIAALARAASILEEADHLATRHSREFWIDSDLRTDYALCMYELRELADVGNFNIE